MGFNRLQAVIQRKTLSACSMTEDYTDDARKRRPNTPVSSRTSSSPEGHSRGGSATSFERWMEELGAVEGPLFKDSDAPFSSEEKLPEVEKDDFWDM